MSIFHNLINAFYASIRNKTKSTGFVSSFILKNHDVFDFTELLEVFSKDFKLDIMWQTPNKDFSELWIYLGFVL